MYKLPKIPRRKKISHKNDYGKFLVWATSHGVVGCGYFVARGIYLAGGGYVKLLIPHENYKILAVLCPESIFFTYNSTDEKEKILKREIAMCDYFICGPGIGVTEDNKLLIEYILNNVRQPLLLDADAIKLLKELKPLLKKAKSKIILTPHEGEFSFISGIEIEKVKKERLDVAVEFAREYNVICVLKGYKTIVTNGEKIYINKSGGPQLAKAGTGDVLTGVIAGLLGLKLNPYDAACLGVYIHGKASELVKKNMSEHSLIPQYLLNAIPSVMKKLG